jgi:hypothetical protein
MATKTEGFHAGEFLVSKADGSRSLEIVTIASGQGVLAAGAVLGQITLGAITQAFTGTGNGVLSALTRSAKAIVGAYVVRCIAAASNAGTFAVFDPNGKRMADATVAVAYNNGEIAFSIADGATDFIVGDVFTLTVAAGSGKWASVGDASQTDGSASARAVLWDAVDATSADQKQTAIVRAAEVNQSALTFGTLSGGAITTAIAQLLANSNISVRSAI